MNFLDRLKFLFGGGAAPADRTAGTPARLYTRSGSSSTVRTGGTLYSCVSPAMSVPTVYCCVEVIAKSVASLPLKYLRKRGDGLFIEDESNLNYLFNVQPDRYLSAPDFWKMAVRWLLLKGNAYIVPVWDNATGDWWRMALVNPDCVSHDTTADTYTIGDATAGVSGVFDESEVIHIKNYSVNGKTGISTLAHARNAVSIMGAGGAEILNRFTNGGTIRGIVGNETAGAGLGRFLDSELEKTAVDIDAKFQGGQHIVSVPGDVKFSPVSLSSSDMQFLETMKFSGLEICRFFGVPPSFVFADTSNNYKSVEMANTILLSQTIRPILRSIEAELQRKLVAPSLNAKRRFVFDCEEFSQGDPTARVAYQKATIEAGLYTVNEWRRKVNKAPVDGGDAVLVSANLKSIRDLESGAAGPQPENVNETKDEDNEE